MDGVRATAGSDGDRGPAARVLLIEDDRALRGYLAECLDLAGYRVTQAENGLDGWRAFEMERPDLVILDLDMPVMSGFRLLQLLPSEPDPGRARVPVVVVTGSTIQQAMDIVVAARPDAYLEKPVASAPFLATIGDLLRGGTAR